MMPEKSLLEENAVLRKQLGVRVDLGGNGEVTLATPYKDLSEKDVADIQVLTKSSEWVAFRRWYLMNAKMLYEQAAIVGKDEAYLMARLAKCLMDMIESAERISPDKHQPFNKDPYDLQQERPIAPGDVLPLGETLD